MEIAGTIVALLPLQTGQGKNGVWKKQEFIMETPGQYPKKVCLSLWGEKVDENIISVGDKITASINIESREYNGRWYTDVRAWKIAKSTGGGQSQEAPQMDGSFAPDTVGSDDLP